MNTIHTYTGKPLWDTPPGFEPTKENLNYRVLVLTDVVQALIEYIAKKEEVQIGVWEVSGLNGNKFSLYTKEMDHCASCRLVLPMTLEGGEDHARNKEGQYICHPCFYKKTTPV